MGEGKRRVESFADMEQTEETGGKEHGEVRCVQPPSAVP